MTVNNRIRRRRLLNYGTVCGLMIALISGFTTTSQTQKLRLSIIDRETGQALPARVELLNSNGEFFIADDALVIGPDVVNRVKPWTGSLDQWKARGEMSKRTHDSHSNEGSFYSSGVSTVYLPPGTYTVKVTKGIEFHVATRTIRVDRGAPLELTVRLSRWVNMSEQGWYSADDHLHIARIYPELDPVLCAWMQAEDLNVANLLQWGHSKHFFNTVQQTHGPDGAYQDGNTIVASGQENPRTHFQGHTIILGASTPIHFPEDYFIYRRFWEEARRQNAIAGYAHLGGFFNLRAGLLIDAPDALVDFMEVLQFNRADYSAWYELLNMGYRMTPTAGTDYPVRNSIPGRERFYTLVRGPFTYRAWLEGIRQGRTFVTNGPVLEFRVGGKGLGDELILKAAGSVPIEGSVQFDPKRDDVQRVEIIRNGEVLQSFPRGEATSKIRFQCAPTFHEAAWVALKVVGVKVGTPKPEKSLAHSAAIYVEVENRPGLADHPRAKQQARASIELLESLEGRLLRESFPEVIKREIGHTAMNPAARGPTEGLGGDELLRRRMWRNREALLREIRAAKTHFAAQAEE